MKEDVVAGILSGGGSRRFGSDKAFALWKGRSLLEWAIENASHLTDNINILAKDTGKFSSFPYPVIEDLFHEDTPLNGILSIIPRVKEWLLLLACDIPFFDPGVLDLLWKNRDREKATVIRVMGKYQPFLGLYPVPVLHFWEEAFAAGDYHLQRIVEKMPRRVIEEEELLVNNLSLLSFSNINTPEDLEKVPF